MTQKQINLLPKESQSELGLRAWYRALLRVYILGAASFLFLIILFFSVTWYFALAEKGLQAEAEQLRTSAATEDTAKIKREVKSINGYIEDYISLSAAAPKWSQLLREFTVLVPAGVQIQSFTVDNVKKVVTVQGFGLTRQDVLALYDAVVANADKFSNIDYPLENVSKPTDINFHYSFTVKDSLLQ